MLVPINIVIWSSEQVFTRFHRKLSEVHRYYYFITLAITKLQIFVRFYFIPFLYRRRIVRKNIQNI